MSKEYGIAFGNGSVIAGWWPMKSQAEATLTSILGSISAHEFVLVADRGGLRVVERDGGSNDYQLTGRLVDISSRVENLTGRVEVLCQIVENLNR